MRRLVAVLMAAAAAVACVPTLPGHEPRPCAPLRAAVTAPALYQGLAHAWEQGPHWRQPIQLVSSDVELVVSFEDLPGGHGGHFEPGDPARIRIDPDLHPSLVVPVVTHEVGHFLGLDHTADPATVMHEDSFVATFTLAERATMAGQNGGC